MLRKTKLENDALQAKICQLNLENVALGATKAKAEDEGAGDDLSTTSR